MVRVKPRGFTLGGGEAWEQAVEHGHIRCGVRPTTLKGLFALSIRSVPFWKPDRPGPHRVTLPELDKEVVKWVRSLGNGRITAKIRALGDPGTFVTIWLRWYEFCLFVHSCAWSPSQDKVWVMASPTPDHLPMGLGVQIDRAVRLADEGHVLIGGSSSLRALRLTPEDVSSVIRWLSGARPDHHRERVLARVLVEAGLAHPRPEPTVPGADVQIVLVGTGGEIDGDELTSTLARIRQEHPHVRPVVVGATGAAARAARDLGARLVNGPTQGAKARALGLGACDAEFVAFLDIGSEPDPGWLDIALGHFADPDVAAVIPRTLAARRCQGHRAMTVAALNALRADRGTDPTPVLPWGEWSHGRGRLSPAGELPVDPLEPPRALVVRREPARLDASLGSAAEVDLVWSLVEAGRSVRYEPRSRVRVPMDARLGAYLGGRFATGASAAPLALRHGRSATGPQVGLPALAAVALVISGRPCSGLAVGAVGVAVDARRLHSGAGVPPVEAVRPALVDLALTARLTGRTARTTWWPALAGVALGGALAWARGGGGAAALKGSASRSPIFRGPAPKGVALRDTVSNVASRDSGSSRSSWGRAALIAGAALTIPHLASWHRRRGTALAGPLAWTVLSVAGDAAGALGTWWGVVRTGSVAPLVPGIQPPASAMSLISVQVGAGAEAPSRKSGSTVLVSEG